MFACQMGVGHRGSEVCVADGLPYQHSRFLVCQPRCDTTVPKIVLHELGRELRPFCGSLEGIVQRADALPRLVVPPGFGVVEYPRRGLTIIFGGAIPKGVLADYKHQPPGPGPQQPPSYIG